MFRITLLVVVFFVSSVFANCEMMRYGFHTIADYKHENKSLSEIHFFTSTSISSPYIFLNNFEMNESKLIDKHSSIASEVKNISYSGKQCSVTIPSKLITSIASKIRTPRVHYCLEHGPTNIGEISHYSDETKTLSLTTKFEISEYSEDVETTNQAILSHLRKLTLKAAVKDNIPLKNTTPVWFKHKKIDTVGTLYSLVKLDVNLGKDVLKLRSDYGNESEKQKEINNFSFYVVVLSRGNKVWYIGDSAGDHCERGLDEQVRRADDNSEYVLGSEINAYSSMDYNSDGAADFLSFGKDGPIYFIDFEKTMTVVKDERYRGVMWNENYLKDKK